HSYPQAMRACGLEDDGSHSSVAAVHPLIAWHDDGRRSLFLSPLHMNGIEGMDAAAGGALLAELVQRSTEPAGGYRHVWQETDIVPDDNRTVMHRGMPYAERTAPRTLHRVVINGEGHVEHLFAPREASLQHQAYARE